MANLAAALHPKAVRLTFRRFRRTRPFWGALFLLVGAYFVGVPLFGGSFAFYVNVGVTGLVPLILAFGMASAAVISVVMPAQRHFPALIAMALSVVSLPLANLGGFFIGMLAGIVGSGLIFAWAPYTDKQLAKFEERAARKQAKKHAPAQAQEAVTA